MTNYIVATIHSWNIEAFNRYSESLPGHWHLITCKDDLTIELIKKLKPEYIFFPHWSWIVPDDIFNYCPCVCFHMTDLPFGRGGSPLQNMILRGITKTKVSALKMTKKLDSGPIFLKKPLSLIGSAEDIFKRLACVIEKMIVKMILTKQLPTEQVGEVTYFKRRTPAQSEVPEDMSPEKLYNFIRMLDAPSYPKAFVMHGDNKITFTDAKLANGALIAQVTISTKQSKMRTVPENKNINTNNNKEDG